MWISRMIIKTRILLVLYKGLHDARATVPSRVVSCLAPFQKLKATNQKTSIAHLAPVPHLISSQFLEHQVHHAGVQLKPRVIPYTQSSSTPRLVNIAANTSQLVHLCPAPRLPPRRRLPESLPWTREKTCLQPARQPIPPSAAGGI